MSHYEIYGRLVHVKILSAFGKYVFPQNRPVDRRHLERRKICNVGVFLAKLVGDSSKRGFRGATCADDIAILPERGPQMHR